MAKIEIGKELVQQHSKEELIRFATDELRAVRMMIAKSIKEKDDRVVYLAAGTLDILYEIFYELDRQNRESELQ